MKKLLLTASVLALIPSAASAQLLGGLGGGLGGGIGGSLGSTVGSTIDTTTRTVRSTVDSTVEGSTDGEQSIDARNGKIESRRSAKGSANASTASLADLPIPSMFTGTASGNGSAEGSANAQLLGTDAVTGAIAPAAGTARSVAGRAAGRASSTATGALSAVPAPGMPTVGGASAEGEGSGSAMGSLMAAPLAVAGSAAGQSNGAATVAPGMPVMTPEGASLGKVKEVVADGRGQVQQVVVKQGKVTRTLPAGMFTSSGSALIAGEAQGKATKSGTAQTTPATGEAQRPAKSGDRQRPMPESAPGEER